MMSKMLARFMVVAPTGSWPYRRLVIGIAPAVLGLVTFFSVLIFASVGPAAEVESSPYTQWKNGPPSDPAYFPIAVWLQDPRNAARYKAAGINVYDGLWRGPTAEQLAALEKAGMKVICSQNRLGMENKDNKTIIGWMHGDEPDNAQSLGQGRGYGPPIKPEVIQQNFEQIRATDPSRPVLLNLGQGVAYDNYIGRGVRRNHPEDYPEYIKGCDIASFDIYPVVHDKPEVAGKLEFVAKGVKRLVKWSGGNKLVWNCIECTHISNPDKKASPQQVRSEVWMALIHGSRGLIYFVHQFKPAFREAALLDDPEMLAGVTTLNQEIHSLAPVLNTTSITNEVTVSVPTGQTAPAFMVKHCQNATYFFAVAMKNEPVRTTFKFQPATPNRSAQVINEARTIPIKNGELTDDFAPYQVHLYRIQN